MSHTCHTCSLRPRLTRYTRRRAAETEPAYSQRLYIAKRQKRTADLEKVNSRISSFLPPLIREHLRNDRLLNIPFATPTISLSILLRTSNSATSSAVLSTVDKIAKYIRPFGGSLISFRSSSSSLVEITAAVESGFETSAHLATSLTSRTSSSSVQVRAHVMFVSSSLSAASPASGQFPSSSMLAAIPVEASLCSRSAFISADSDAPSSPLVIFEDYQGADDNVSEVSTYWLMKSVVDAGPGTGFVVGREQERDVIHMALVKFLLGDSRQALLIVGPAGHGKSTLTKEIAAFGEMASNATFVYSAAASMKSGAALEIWTTVRSPTYNSWPVVRDPSPPLTLLSSTLSSLALPFARPQVFSGLLARTNMCKEDIRCFVRDRNPTLLKKIALLNGVLPADLRVAEGEEVKKLSGDAASSGTLALCETLLKLIISKVGRVILVIEDVHWCSSLELRLLVAITSIESGLMLILNSRPFRATDMRLSDFSRLKNSITDVVELGSFTDEDVRELAHERLAKLGMGDDILEQFVEASKTHAKSLPLVVQKLLHELEELGPAKFFDRLHVPADGEGEGADADSEVKASSLGRRRSSLQNAVAIFQEDFKRLDASAFKVLSSIAVLAARSDPVQIRSVLGGMDASTVNSALAELEKKSLVELESDGSVVIQHKIIEEAVVRSMVSHCSCPDQAREQSERKR